VATSPTTNSAPVAQPSEPAVAVTAPAVDDTTVKLTVAATPPDARVTLDGAPLPSLPYAGDFRKSGAVHQLEATADGHQPLNQLVVLDRDRQITIVLRPLPAAATRLRPRRSPPPSATVSAALPTPGSEATTSKPQTDEPVAPGVELKTKQKANRFDMNDPYAE
jgi:hypothetical protein